MQVISRFQPRPQNQVIATRLPVDSTWSDEWKHGADGPPRGYVFTAIELPQKRFLLTYSLHLKSNVGAPAMNVPKRQEAARQLLIHAQEMQKLYGARGACGLLLGGDMNTSLDDPRFAKEQTLHALTAAGLHWTFAGVPFASRITIPKKGKYADNCFDHIFTVGLGKQTASVKPYPGRSDHNPVILDLDLSKVDFQPRLGTAAGLALLKAATPAPAAPAQSAGYAASVNSEVFHKAGCKSAAKISAKNLVRFKTREEAIQAGKRPCKECKP
jgi:endonuclease/exonuclease/phosphatase family metal-dependent hydrolase